jgi:hypothetical protein
MQRNFLRGPGFSWEDFFLTKKFKLTEHATLSVDGQFYNVFNHPNFATFGNVTAGTPGDISTLHGFGNISGMSQPPTGLLGSGFGQDTSVRMIAFRARIEF